MAERPELKKRADRRRVKLTRLVWPNYAIITHVTPAPAIRYLLAVVCRTNRAPAVVSRPPVPT